ncbi:MAG: hypothetical protein CM1200mP2_51200 [Planctomycetaceae bacterium]|nr:MAG: hypothetical protein CM1200mP2_51200 [Planctomycetaceae bacterium]
MPLLEPRKRTRRNLVSGASTVCETIRRTFLFLARLTIVFHLVPSAELWTWYRWARAGFPPVDPQDLMCSTLPSSTCRVCRHCLGPAPAGAGVASMAFGRSCSWLFFRAGLGCPSEATLPSPQHLVTTVLAPGAVEVGATAKAAIVSLVFLSVARKSFPGVPAAGPQQAAGQHVEVGRFDHRLVVVPDGGGKDAGVVIAIGPDTDLGVFHRRVAWHGPVGWRCRTA